MAINMADSLGFSDYTVAQMGETIYDQKILQGTWDSIKLLDGMVRSSELSP